MDLSWCNLLRSCGGAQVARWSPGHPKRSQTAPLDDCQCPRSGRQVGVLVLASWADIKITDKTMKALKRDGVWPPHDWHGEWNYTSYPHARAYDLAA